MNKVLMTGRIVKNSGLKDKDKGLYVLMYIDTEVGEPLTLVLRGTLATLWYGVKVGEKIFVEGVITKSKKDHNVYIDVLHLEKLDYYVIEDNVGEIEMEV